MSAEDLLDGLLAAAEELKPTRKLIETDIFKKTTNLDLGFNPNDKESVVHTGLTDSSDDEDNKYYDDQKYNSSGKTIKRLLQTTDSPTLSSSSKASSLSADDCLDTPQVTLSLPKIDEKKTKDVYCDPIFGIRIVNPLVSSTMLKERMNGRTAVPFSQIARHLQNFSEDSNWVIGGVVVSKSAVKTSKKGGQFIVWTLSDLKSEIKTISLFLFSGAYKQFWKSPVGTVVGILNPSHFKNDSSSEQITLNVDNAQKIMILGESKDFGTCKSVKKNGDKCNAIVNKSSCEYCLYHIKREYQNCSKRSELQANFAGRGLDALRNKVLGKSEVFYAGKSYTAIPTKKSKKLVKEDRRILLNLEGSNGFLSQQTKKESNSNAKERKQNARCLEISQQQRLKDLELLKKLGGTSSSLDSLGSFSGEHSNEVTVEQSRNLAANLKAKQVVKKAESVMPINTPVLTSGDSTSKTIDLNKPISNKLHSRATLNAIKFIQKHGPLKKVDPNAVRKPKSMKRSLEEVVSENPAKKTKLDENEHISDRFKKMMAMTSQNSHLLEQKDQEEQEKYFKKLEVKERLEEKMTSTYKVPCKAVKCLKCKYTNFSASDLCKKERHPLKVYDAVKRFFKCGDCGNRTVTLNIVPEISCKKCGSGKWEKTGMMKEKNAMVAHSLSIRGGEQKFTNSCATDTNINLLMPEE